MIKRLLRNNECRLQLLQQPAPIRALPDPHDPPLLEARDESRGSSLRYAGLSARDADGRALRAGLELRGRALLLRLDDLPARYPLRIDPFLRQAEPTASDGQAKDGLGTLGGNSSQRALYLFVDRVARDCESRASSGVPSESFACPPDDRCHGADLSAACNEQH
jgi:hypothetical protein